MADMVIGDNGEVYNAAQGFQEICGENIRGGQQIVGAQDAYQILGELMAQSPAMKNYVQKRALANRPMVQQVPLAKARDWQIDFGPVSGTAGTQTTVVVNPQVLFRGEKMMATDTGANAAGFNTRIGAIFVGQKSQRPANSGATLTAFFANNSLGNGIKWDTCDKALSISLTISFITTSTFDATVFGKAVL